MIDFWNYRNIENTGGVNDVYFPRVWIVPDFLWAFEQVTKKKIT